MVRKDSLFHILLPSLGDSRTMPQERPWLERRERGEPFAPEGCLPASPAQRVPVLAGTLPLAVVISHSAAHGEGCGPAALPPGTMLAPQTRGGWDSAPADWRQPRAGLPFFSFSTSQVWHRSRKLSSCGLSACPQG